MILQYDPENGWHLATVAGTVVQKFDNIESAFAAYEKWLEAPTPEEQEASHE